MALSVRFRVRVRVLTFLLVGREHVDEVHLLAPDDPRTRSLGAEHPGLVVSTPAVHDVRLAVGCERVQLVVATSAEDAVGAPAAEQGVLTVAP